MWSNSNVYAMTQFLSIWYIKMRTWTKFLSTRKTFFMTWIWFCHDLELFFHNGLQEQNRFFCHCFFVKTFGVWSILFSSLFIGDSFFHGLISTTNLCIMLDLSQFFIERLLNIFFRINLKIIYYCHINDNN